MKNGRFLKALLMVSVWLPVPSAFAQIRPVALDSFSTNGPLYVLRDDGTILRSSTVKGVVNAGSFIKIPSSFTAVDISASTIFNRQELIFVSMNSRNGRVSEYSGSGDEVAHWDLPEPVWGLDVSPNHTLYVAGVTSRTVYSVSLSGDPRKDMEKQFAPFATVGDAANIGPLVSWNEILYVADTLHGTVYSIGSDRKAKQIIVGCGQPAAIRARDVSGNGTQVVVADTISRRLLTAVVGPQTVNAKAFSEPGLSDPSSITVSARGGFVVADRGNSSIEEVDANGKLISRTFLQQQFVTIHGGGYPDIRGTAQLERSLSNGGFSMNTDNSSNLSATGSYRIDYFTKDATVPRLVQEILAHSLGVDKATIQLNYVGEQFPSNRKDTVGIWLRSK